MFKKSFFVVFLFGLFGFVHAQVDPMNLPKLTQYVSDFSNVLDQNQRNLLNTQADAYERQTSNQLVAVLIPNRNGRELFDIGMNIFNTNAIGQAGKNNGLLLVISTDEKKIRIVVGYGLESKIPDLLASRMIEEDIRPLVNNGDFYGAIQAFYNKSIQYIQEDNGGNGKTVADYKMDSYLPIIAIVGFILGIILAFISKLFIKKTPNKLTKYIVIIYFVLLAIARFFTILFLLYFLVAILIAFVFVLSPKNGGGSFGGGGFSGGFGGGGGFDGGGGSSGGGGAGD